MRLIEARYEERMLKLTEPLPLRSGELVNLIVVRRADPNRWDRNRFAKSGSTEDLTLAEQGIEDWAAQLEQEDQN